MAEFRMPSLGADMEAGTLVEWMVKPGDHVKRGDIVAVVETQKGAIEIEVFETGEIEEIHVGLGAKVPVGTPLARIRTEGKAEVPAVLPASTDRAATPPRITRPVLGQEAVQVRAPASPAARRLAQEHGADLSAIKGSGPSGAVTLADVERHIAGMRVPPERTRVAGIDLDAMRAAIAAAMARSKREIPHYYLAHQLDVTDCTHWLSTTNMGRQPEDRLLLGVLAVKTVALALHRFPVFNGFFREGKFEPSAAVHVGMAIAIRGGGLAAPALRDADKLPLNMLMANMRDLVQRMRAGRIRSSEISDPTITVSSLGERGIEALYGIIYPPQVAIVGFGKAVTRPWVVGDEVKPRSVITITLAADHRVSDGHIGALFLAEIGKLLQEPDKL